jgi:hypothetical protein
MQGMGVSVPIAAAVADATAGLARDWHIPKGMTLTIGTLSIIVASGVFETVLATGSTFSTDGAIPNEQVMEALPHTQNPIYCFSFLSVAPDFSAQGSRY